MGCFNQGSEGESPLTLSIAIVLVMFLIVVFVWSGRSCGADTGTDTSSMTMPAPRETFDMWTSAGSRRPHLFSTADVDPQVTGQLYAHRDHTRTVYGNRTSHGHVQGLAEFISDRDGGLGVDVGPHGLAEYGGRRIGYDDGIPETWKLPATPMRWYVPEGSDFYGPEGPTTMSNEIYTTFEPDHDPLVG